MADTTPPKLALKEKAPKVAKESKEPKEKKPRAPRKDYGFLPDAVIKLTEGEKNYKGKRKEMYEALKKSNGKTVQHFLDNNKNDEDPPRGWIRFFVQNEAIQLIGGTKKEPAKPKEAVASA